MQDHPFLYDFGYLPKALFENAEILTPADLIDSPAWRSIVSLCTEGSINHSRSQYEHFQAVCQALPQMEGHPLKKDLSAFWKEYFGELPLPSPERVDLLWRHLTDRFFANATPRERFLPIPPWNCITTSEMLLKLPRGAAPMLEADHFLRVKANGYDAWKREILQTLDAFCGAGCRQILLTLPTGFTFTVPDLYHVGVVLKQDRRSKADADLLCAQLLREITVEAQKRKLALLLRVLCDGAQAEAALGYLERSVELPITVWSTPHSETAKCLLSCSTHQNLLLPALCMSDMPSEFELQATLATYAARYPVGRLQFLTGADVPLLPYARERVYKTLQENLKKL